MKDNRYVDDLSIEELERVLLVKRREARLARLRRMDRNKPVVGRDPLEPPPPLPTLPPIPTEHRQFEGMGASADYRSTATEERRQRFVNARLVSARLLGWLALPLRIKWRFVFNGFLLLVEVTAVAALILIVRSTWQNREEITAEAEEISVPPTATVVPTVAPRVLAVLLPGGHTPPDAGGFSQPEPIPENLQGLAAAITPQPVPTRGPEHATRIVIPSIGVDHPVVLGDDWEALKRGVGHTLWSANPGGEGNCVLTAHNDIFGSIFRRLPEMALGDEIFVYAVAQLFRYIVKATRIVEPSQVELMYPTDQPTLTLISCYPYLVDDKRIVVIAQLERP